MKTRRILFALLFVIPCAFAQDEGTSEEALLRKIRSASYWVSVPRTLRKANGLSFQKTAVFEGLPPVHSEVCMGKLGELFLKVYCGNKTRENLVYVRWCNGVIVIEWNCVTNKWTWYAKPPIEEEDIQLRQGIEAYGCSIYYCINSWIEQGSDFVTTIERYLQGRPAEPVMVDGHVYAKVKNGGEEFTIDPNLAGPGRPFIVQWNSTRNGVFHTREYHDVKFHDGFPFGYVFWLPPAEAEYTEPDFSWRGCPPDVTEQMLIEWREEQSLCRVILAFLDYLRKWGSLNGQSLGR